MAEKTFHDVEVEGKKYSFYYNERTKNTVVLDDADILFTIPRRINRARLVRERIQIYRAGFVAGIVRGIKSVA